MLKGRSIVIDTTGEMARNPIFARGVVRSIDDHLKEALR